MIRAIIKNKEISDGNDLKTVRYKIRKFGFYTSDFGRTLGNAELDFRGVIKIIHNGVKHLTDSEHNTDKIEILPYEKKILKNIPCRSKLIESIAPLYSLLSK